MTASSLHALDARPARLDPRRILGTALAVALLDGLYVVLVFAARSEALTAQRLFQGIAVPPFGRGVIGGGWWTAALGALIHTGVSLGWTVVWAAGLAWSGRLRTAVREPARAIALGVAYGLFVHLAMQLVVLPLTPHARPAPLLGRTALLVLLAHLTVIGPVIVLGLRGRSAR